MPKSWIIYSDDKRWWVALDGTGPGYIHIAGGSHKYCIAFLKALKQIPVKEIK